MAKTTRRALDLLALLQTPRTWTGPELCARLGVDPRTLRRDVERLRELGYGVAARRGVGGGYRLADGAHVPPLVLSEEESIAIAVGLQGVAGGAVADIGDAASAALAKLERSLGSAARHRIADLQRAVLAVVDVADPVTAGTLALTARAIREHRRIRADYTRHDGETVRRLLEPHRVVLVGRRWYLVGRDAERDAWRTLRLDRLVPREPLGARFEPTEIPEDVLRTFTVRSISTAPYPLRGRMRLRAPAHVVREQLPVAAVDVIAVDEERCEVVAGANRWSELALYVGLVDAEIEAVSPAALAEELARIGARFQRAGGSAGARRDVASI